MAHHKYTTHMCDIPFDLFAMPLFKYGHVHLSTERAKKLTIKRSVDGKTFVISLLINQSIIKKWIRKRRKEHA